MKSLGEWMKTWRKAAGWRQEELALRLDVKQASVSRWENDNPSPDLETVRALYDLFTRAGVNPSAPPIITGRGEQKCQIIGTIHQGGIVRDSDELETVEVPPGLGDRPIVAYRIATDALNPFGNNWLIFTPQVTAGVDKAECSDKLCMVRSPEHGTLLGWLRRAGTGYALERINAPMMPLGKLDWAARVLDIRPQ
jgi:transcriptional regulator with XRE-family HTH domain